MTNQQPSAAGISQPAKDMIAATKRGLDTVLGAATDTAGHTYAAVKAGASKRTDSGGTSPGDSSQALPDGLIKLANDLVGAVVEFTTQVAVSVAKEAVATADKVGATVGANASVAAPVIDAVRGAAGVAVAAESPVLEFPAASPSQRSTVAVEVRNDSTVTFDVVRLRCHALVGPGGATIPGDVISASPPSVEVQPRSSTTVQLSVDIPALATRGRYVGLIEAADLSGVQLVASLDVI